MLVYDVAILRNQKDGTFYSVIPDFSVSAIGWGFTIEDMLVDTKSRLTGIITEYILGNVAVPAATSIEDSSHLLDIAAMIDRTTVTVYVDVKVE